MYNMLENVQMLRIKWKLRFGFVEPDRIRVNPHTFDRWICDLPLNDPMQYRKTGDPKMRSSVTIYGIPIFVNSAIPENALELAGPFGKRYRITV